MLLDRDPEVLSDAELEDGITELSAHIDAATCRLLDFIGEFDRRKAWGGIGVKGCAHWLSWKCGIGLNAAREKVRVANALPGLPKVREALAEGRISYSKARAITRIGTSDNEDFLLQIALQGTAAHVEELVRQQRVIAQNREEDDSQSGRDGRELMWWTDSSGYLVIQGRLPPEWGESEVRGGIAERAARCRCADDEGLVEPIRGGGAPTASGQVGKHAANI